MEGRTVGWPEFIRAVAAAWQSIPAADRRDAVIVTDNYGEAGAIDLLGRHFGLPHAYSGHNGYADWVSHPPPRPGSC